MSLLETHAAASSDDLKLYVRRRSMREMEEIDPLKLFPFGISHVGDADERRCGELYEKRARFQQLNKEAEAAEENGDWKVAADMYQSCLDILLEEHVKTVASLYWVAYPLLFLYQARVKEYTRCQEVVNALMQYIPFELEFEYLYLVLVLRLVTYAMEVAVQGDELSGEQSCNNYVGSDGRVPCFIRLEKPFHFIWVEGDAARALLCCFWSQQQQMIGDSGNAWHWIKMRDRRWLTELYKVIPAYLRREVDASDARVLQDVGKVEQAMQKWLELKQDLENNAMGDHFACMDPYEQRCTIGLLCNAFVACSYDYYSSQPKFKHDPASVANAWQSFAQLIVESNVNPLWMGGMVECIQDFAQLLQQGPSFGCTYVERVLHRLAGDSCSLDLPDLRSNALLDIQELKAAYSRLERCLEKLESASPRSIDPCIRLSSHLRWTFHHYMVLCKTAMFFAERDFTHLEESIELCRQNKRDSIELWYLYNDDLDLANQAVITADMYASYFVMGQHFDISHLWRTWMLAHEHLTLASKWRSKMMQTYEFQDATRFSYKETNTYIARGMRRLYTIVCALAMATEDSSQVQLHPEVMRTLGNQLPDPHQHVMVWSERTRNSSMLSRLRYWVQNSSPNHHAPNDHFKSDDDDKVVWNETVASLVACGEGAVFVVISEFEGDPEYSRIHLQTCALWQEGERFVLRAQALDKVSLLAMTALASSKCTHHNDTNCVCRQSLAFLHNILIEPISDILDCMTPEQNLVFIPTTMFDNVPFSILIDPEGNYLFERHTICVAHSLRILHLCDLRRKSLQGLPLGSGLAVGNPTFKDKRSLPASEEEVDSIIELFPHVKKLTGNAATSRALLEHVELCSKSQQNDAFVHVATHGTQRDKETQRGGLHFAEARRTHQRHIANHRMASTGSEAISLAEASSCEVIRERDETTCMNPQNDENKGDEVMRGSTKGALLADDIAKSTFPWNTLMVVLSACESGLGETSVEGPFNLPRALMLAGVPCAVASQWKVEDTATKKLMCKFYNLLKRGNTVAASLRKAMLQVRQLEGFQASNIHQWGAFLVWGLPTITLPKELQSTDVPEDKEEAKIPKALALVRGHDLLINKFNVKYIGKHCNIHRRFHPASTRMNQPIPLIRGTSLFYLEVKVLNGGDDTSIGIGFSDSATFSRRQMPGWYKGSCGYHGDDGHMFQSCLVVEGEPYGPTFKAGDIVGAGYILDSKEIFFTKNGRSLGRVESNLATVSIYPVIALGSPREEVEVNLGQDAFVYKSH